MLAALSMQASAVLAQAAQCTSGQNQPCANDAACAGNRDATLCVGTLGSATCQVPCSDGFGAADSSLCALGETCVAGPLPAGAQQGNYCRPAPFSMDLNLLDQCLYYFLEGITPVSSANACSLQSSLNALLDTPAAGALSADGVFNIDDVDRCITAFLQPQLCDPVNGTCPGGDIYCDTHADCGDGAFCNGGIHRCERECGLIATREASGITSVDRPCSGALKVCDMQRGSCYTPTELGTCQVDDDCPNASYCLVGQCTPRCYRTTDCPDSTWLCSTTNRCEPAPLDPSASTAFDPLSYSLSFANRNLRLGRINDRYDIPLLIMNLATRAQVLDDPAVVFGYRLEMTDYRKLEDKCLGDLGDLSQEDREDCIISPDEEFITLDSPFGTVYGLGSPEISLRLNHAAADLLSPGDYQVTVRAIFNNGDTTTATVRFNNPSANGDYLGNVAIYMGSEENLLGRSNLAMRLFVDEDAPTVEWDALLQENNVPTGNEFIDITRGRRVTGYIDGGASMPFAWPDAYDVKDNQVPVRGIYSEDTGRMRLISVIDLPAEHCRSEGASGRCSSSDSSSLQVRNSFGRDLRRTLHFLGTFDGLRNRFEGMYREDISGMFPNVVTLEGEFRLDQTVQRDDRPTEPAHILGLTIPNGRPTTVNFPADVDVEQALEADIATYCPGDFSDDFGVIKVPGHFKNSAAFDKYLSGFHASGYGSDGVVDGPILEQLITFEGRIQTALNTLGAGTGSALTLADFFKGQIQFCSGSVTTQCVDQNKLKCGLALYRKAILKGWVQGLALGPERSETLFCHIRPGVGQDCPTGASPLLTAADKAVVGFQEHSRFYKELVQTYSYEAAGAISDAFFTLYKASNGDALDSNSAYVHKDINLRKALSAYESVQRAILSPASTRVMQSWPMEAFATRGGSWIKQMHTVMNDRLDGMLELLDLRRRVIGNNGDKVEMFARHVMHHEYLNQVYLMAMQSQWEGGGFAYAGQGPEALAAGSLLLAKVNSGRNPIGLHPNRIYFENSSLALSNWQGFRDRLTQQIPALEQTIAGAIREMKGALSDKDNFESSLLMRQQEIEAQLDQICGKPIPLTPTCTTDYFTKTAIVAECSGDDCPFEFRCEDSACQTVHSYFDNNTQLACRSDVPTSGQWVPVQGLSRLCVNGEMGLLLQERASLEDQRTQVIHNLQALIRRVAREDEYISQTKLANDDLLSYLKKQGDKLADLELAIFVADVTYTGARDAASMLNCTLPTIGFSASPGSCVGAVAGGIAAAAASTVYTAATKYATRAQSDILRAKEIRLTSDAQAQQLRRERMERDNMMTEVENLVYSYNTLSQQLLNVGTRIADTSYRARQMAKRHAEQIENIVDHLLGRESGSVLVRNRLVQQANTEFREMLVEVYKMAQAFSHRYNLGSDGIALQNEVFSIQTVDEIKWFVDRLNDLERGYCGVEGLDCDSANNWEVFEFSVQKQVFPNLRPIMDANGNVLTTVGQQFHDEITSSKYLKRRSRASGVRSQVELPIQIWLQDRGDAGGAVQRYMVNPDECNHFLVAGRGGQQGNVAVNVVGTRLRSDKNITYELQRGANDFVRDCHQRTASGEAELNKYIIGWSPAHAFGQVDAPPSFLTRSSGFTACENAYGLGQPVVPGNLEGCFRYFARDRSLASNDWKLIIPQMDDEQYWLIDPDVPQHERPIIEDIVLYFRYNARPITNF